MQKLIIIKYGELTTKKDNIGFFLQTLKQNIAAILSNLPVEIKQDAGRMFIYTDEGYLELVKEKLAKVFGIHEIIEGYVDNDFTIEQIKANALALMQARSFQTFKIETKRSNKNYPLESMAINRAVGSFILKNIPNLKVDVHHPDLLFNIEIRHHEVLYYGEKIAGLGGYPVGTLGKGLLMLSGGIDSPVAGFMAIKRGIKLEAIYFESSPHTSEQAKNKVKSLARILALYNATVKLHVINFTTIQETILKNIPHEYLITIMRRMMYRISEAIAQKNKCQIIVNGESIGQVASQTLTSMSCINEVVKIPVIRPLACFDKLEIITLAKKIGSYETSILPFEDCCTIFVPTHPVINPQSKKCIEYEKLIPYADLINEAITTEEVIYLDSEKDNLEYRDIL